MRKLSLITAAAILFLQAAPGLAVPKSDSPHGADFKVPCSVCHSASGWKLDRSIYSFDHNKTALPLTGQHVELDCRACHISLVFSEAKSSCVDCHTDLHDQTLGPDCGRCHTPKSWIVEDITGLHQRGRFPLQGAHYTAACQDCHQSASLLRFEPRGVECINCHQKDYNATTSPNHAQSGYSTECTECHKMTGFTWTGANFNHSTFPLIDGHALPDCKQCHTSGTFTKLPTECVSCHQANYNATTNPNHQSLNFPLTCNDCHTLKPGWKPANYTQHDAQYFPIYSGKHNGQWSMCTDCHLNPSNYLQYTCTSTCHLQGDMDSKHGGVGGYSYNDGACLACHPTGSSEGSFNHNSSIFPLTGAHVTTPCNQCHVTQYAGTPTGCPDCHIANYNATTNPNHVTAGIPNTCATCHTTDPGWKPALFPDHNNYYPLTGAHTTTDCNSCHNNNYSNTPNTCVGCHLTNYNNTTNPNHTSAGIGTTCADCHTTNPGWSPATFSQHNNYYLLTGAHTTVSCNNCHNGNYANTPNTCVGCHLDNYNATTNPPHATAGIGTTCADCHTTNPGWQPATFAQHNSYYPLTGAHTTVSCNSCHNGNYTTTPNTCVGCHLANYNATTNPPHASAGIGTTCADCHTTNPGWSPATFAQHNNYYPLTGAHISVSCNACHNGNYTNIPNTCVGCHLTDYNQTNNPPHASAQFPTDCQMCHTTAAWIPSTFDHDGQYFPIYSGKHAGEWNLCSDCHTNPGDYSVFTCLTCHGQSQTNEEHNGVPGYSYNSNACYNCHPNGNAPMMAKPKINRKEN